MEAWLLIVLIAQTFYAPPWVIEFTTEQRCEAAKRVMVKAMPNHIIFCARK